MGTYSQERLEEKILKAISLLIVQKEIKNRKVSSLVSPVSVRLAQDNSSAIVYITGYGDKKILTDSVEGLNESHSFIQKKLSEYLKTKNTPVLEFREDKMAEEKEKIDQLLDKISAENNSQN